MCAETIIACRRPITCKNVKNCAGGIGESLYILDLSLDDAGNSSAVEGAHGQQLILSSYQPIDKSSDIIIQFCVKLP